MIFFFSNIFVFFGPFGSVLVNKSHVIKRKVVEVQLLRTKFHGTNTSIGLWHLGLSQQVKVFFKIIQYILSGAAVTSNCITSTTHLSASLTSNHGCLFCNSSSCAFLSMVPSCYLQFKLLLLQSRVNLKCLLQWKRQASPSNPQTWSHWSWTRPLILVWP